MRTVLVAYMVLYGLIWAFTVVAETIIVPAEKRDPLWELILDVLLLGTGFAGMVFYLQDWEIPTLKSAWKLVAPALIVAQGWMYARYRRQRRTILEEGDLSLTPNEARAMEYVVHAMLIPSLFINLMYAY